MPSKKVTITPKPQERNADAWVNGGEINNIPSYQNDEATPITGTSALASHADDKSIQLKRLTIDIPEDLHTRIKSQCALRRTKMADEIRVLLENHFSA